MIPISRLTRRAMILSTIRTTSKTLTKHVQQQQRPKSSLSSSRIIVLGRPQICTAVVNRRLLSTSPPSSKPQGAAAAASKPKKTGSSELLPNIVLASALGGFVTFVFLYSMNAVGRGDGNAAEGRDPLAQLKAEAQEAREAKDREGSGGRMTPDEIRALESGLVMEGEDVNRDRIIREVAVAAPADIAAIEEEANLKIFRQRQQDNQDTTEPKKKKPWWRFGF